MSGELAEIQSELQAIKKALRDGLAHLGMKGENLQRYLLQLNEKENLLLSKQLRHMSLGGGDEGATGKPMNGHAAGVVVRKDTAPARAPPEGEVKAFNRDLLAEVVAHMTVYEAVPPECAKALRALSSLAYANAAGVGGDDNALPQLLRLMALHPDEGLVQVGGMRALCNMAFDQKVAVTKLADPEVLSALLGAVAGSDPKEKSKNGEAAAKAGEAVARIVAAEVNPEDNGVAPKEYSKSGPLAGLFLTASGGDETWRQTVPWLAAQLVANEVCEARPIADCFALAGQCIGSNAAVAVGWMNLAKLFAATDNTIPALPQALVDTGAIRTVVELMRQIEGDGAVQLCGVETMSALVGNRWAGLQSFAEGGGMKRIEAALGAHPDNALLQTKGIRALASGIQWPQDVQQKASYDSKKSVELTKQAMAKHGNAMELLQAGLEALSKYLDKLRCLDAVMEGGGEGLVKAIMTKHRDAKTIQTVGRVVLNHLGVDRAWAPGQGTAAAPQS